jgi:uncharacterized protein (DUF111 family)
MDRQTQIKETAFGPIRMKKASYKEISKESPEYEDCVKIANKTGIPLKDILGKI